MSFSLLFPEPPPPRRSTRIGRHFWPTIRYWFGLDSHVYSMAIAGNVLFGFFPFMLLILSIARYVIPSSGAEQAIYIGLRAFLPEDPGLVDFVIRNLRVAVESRGAVQITSIVLLIIASNGIFMPLEVAQNRLWGFPKNRSYWLNQLTSFCITSASMAAAMLAAVFAVAVGPLLAETGLTVTRDGGILAALKAAETLALVLIFVLVYWVLPNGRVPFRRAFWVAVLAALTVEAGQLAYSWVWPWLDLRSEYGPFFISITLLLWGFLAAMAVLAGAEICSRPARLEPELREPETFAEPPKENLE